VSDNGPCCNSKEWQQFAKQYGFQHVTSSPQHAQANGKAEKGLHIIKHFLKKATDSKSDPYLALLSYRTAPLECSLSPAELLMNRKLHTTLPWYTDLIGKYEMETKTAVWQVDQDPQTTCQRWCGAYPRPGCIEMKSYCSPGGRTKIIWSKHWRKSRAQKEPFQPSQNQRGFHWNTMRRCRWNVFCVACRNSTIPEIRWTCACGHKWLLLRVTCLEEIWASDQKINWLNMWCSYVVCF